MVLSQEDRIALDAAKVMIENAMEQLEYWQRRYRSICGRSYSPPFLTDPVNRATLSTNPKQKGASNADH